MLNPKTLNEALSIVYAMLQEFEYILFQGQGQFGYEEKILGIALGYWSGTIAIHLTDEKFEKICSCKVDSISELQRKLNRIIKGYKLDIHNIAYIKDSATKEIAEFGFNHKKQIFKVISTTQGEQTVSVSYQIIGRLSNEKLLLLSKTYENLIKTICENSDIQVLKINPHPITLIRNRKLRELGTD